MTRGQRIIKALRRFADRMDKLRPARRKTEPIKCNVCNHYTLEMTHGRRECSYCILQAAYNGNLEAFDKQGKDLLVAKVALVTLDAAAQKVAALVTQQVYHKEPSNQTGRYAFNRHESLIDATNKLKALLKDKENRPCAPESH